MRGRGREEGNVRQAGTQQVYRQSYSPLTQAAQSRHKLAIANKSHRLYRHCVWYRGQLHMATGSFHGPGRSRRPRWSYFFLHRSIKCVKIKLNNKGKCLTLSIAICGTFLPSKSTEKCKKQKTLFFVGYARMIGSQWVVAPQDPIISL